MLPSVAQDPPGGPQKENPLSIDLAVGGLLPLIELTPQDLETATEEESVSWFWGLMGRYRPGDLHSDFAGLITLQKVSLDTVRCVRVYDYVGCYWYLSMLRATCSKAGITLDLNMTLVTPLMAGEEEEIISIFSQEEGSFSPKPKQVTAEAKGVASHATAGEDDGYNVGMEVA